jgi:hypothetical protein
MVLAFAEVEKASARPKANIFVRVFFFPPYIYRRGAGRSDWITRLRKALLFGVCGMLHTAPNRLLKSLTALT